MSLPLHVNLVAEGTDQSALQQAREIILKALPALDDNAPRIVEEEGAPTRFDFRKDDLIIGTTLSDLPRAKNQNDVEERPRTMFFAKGQNGIGITVTVNTPMPLIPYVSSAQSVRDVSNIALACIDVCLADEEDKKAATMVKEYAVIGIGYIVAQTQGYDDVENVDVRLPSPFSEPRCKAWGRKGWAETLSDEHASWHICDAVEMMVQRRQENHIIIHISPAPSINPEPGLDPITIMRAIATLPPAPPPMVVV